MTEEKKDRPRFSFDGQKNDNQQKFEDRPRRKILELKPNQCISHKSNCRLSMEEYNSKVDKDSDLHSNMKDSSLKSENTSKEKSDFKKNK